MNGTMSRIYLWLFILGSMLVQSCLLAQQNKLDLLIGVGDFEKCSYSKIAGIDSKGMDPVVNYQIADGWSARTVDHSPKDGTLSLDDLADYKFKIVDPVTFVGDGKEHLIAGKSYQYTSLQYRPDASALSHLASVLLPFPQSPASTFLPGDKVIFHVDQIIGSNFSSTYKPTVSIGISQQGASGAVDSQVNMSAGYVNNVSCTFTIANSNPLWVYVQIRLPKAPQSVLTPGILFTGARLWVERRSSQLTEPDIPSTIDRTIRTSKLCYRKAARATAKKYDIVMLNAGDYIDMPLMRKINPNIKFHLYQTTCAMESETDVKWMLSPLKIEDVAANHPEWLYPQTVPALSTDPNTSAENSPYVGKYLNVNGLADKFVCRLGNKQYQDEWVRVAIKSAKAIGVDGIWIDEGSCLQLARDGAQRDTWEVQQFLHAVVPKLRAAGLEVVFMDVLANLDGSVGYCGDYTEVFYNPFWKPTDALPLSAGYAENTPKNTPDVFFREYSLMYNNHRYNSEYWLRCLNDAKIVADWNSKLPPQYHKRIYYDVQQEDTAEHPAFNKNGKAGWGTFTFASFLLCQNEYVHFGAGYGRYNGHFYEDAKIDYSITRKLGVPDGDAQQISNNKYFLCRAYKPYGSGSMGGVVVVNGDTKTSKTYTLPFDANDENGTLYASGSKITFLPNMGRIFTRVATSPDIGIKIHTSANTVTSGQIVTVNVEYANSGSSEAKNVIVRAVVPEQLIYVAGSAEESGGTYESATNSAVWVISSLAAGGTGTKSFKAKVP